MQTGCMEAATKQHQAHTQAQLCTTRPCWWGRTGAALHGCAGARAANTQSERAAMHSRGVLAPNALREWEAQGPRLKGGADAAAATQRHDLGQHGVDQRQAQAAAQRRACVSWEWAGQGRRAGRLWAPGPGPASSLAKKGFCLSALRQYARLVLQDGSPGRCVPPWPLGLVRCAWCGHQLCRCTHRQSMLYPFLRERSMVSRRATPKHNQCLARPSHLAR